MMIKHTPNKILVVDDEASLVQLCKLILEHAGFEVRGAYNGNQALHLITEDVPDLIILDMMMPGMDGIEVCKRIRTQYSQRHPYIVIYTADDSEKTRQSGMIAGANELITKDTPISELANKIISRLPVA
ncbi:MAG: response regulator [Chloroflexi bacterium]|nr:response regulator [Chloroflexota bacterium]